MSLEAWLAARDAVLADPDLQSQLWPLDLDGFRQRVRELGAPAEGSWPWDPGPLLLPVAAQAAPLLPEAPLGPGWVPVHLDLLTGPPAVVWRQTGGERPMAGLHPSDVQAWSRRPLNRFLDVRTPLEVLDAPLEPSARQPPVAGLVFHMSRCGSTLVSRMLGQIAGVVSLSEPRIVGDILRLGRFAPGLDPARQADWLRRAVARAGAGGERVVIKTEAGGLFGWDLLRRAFPETPWVFLHRDPLDVMLSQERQRSSEMMPIMLEAALPLPPEQAQATDPDEHCARTLAALCDRAAETVAAGNGLAIAYEDLPGAVGDYIAPLFGLQPAGADLARMADVALRHARRGEAVFVDERDARRAAAPARLVALADRLARPAWNRLRGQG